MVILRSMFREAFALTFAALPGMSREPIRLTAGLRAQTIAVRLAIATPGVRLIPQSVSQKSVKE